MLRRSQSVKQTTLYTLSKLYFNIQISRWSLSVFMPTYLFIHKNRLTKTEVLQGRRAKSEWWWRQKHNYMNYNNKSHCFSIRLTSFPWDLGVRSSSLVNSMRRRVTGQMQEPEDDVTGVASFELAVLLVSFLLHEAGLICGAAFCSRVLSYCQELGCLL